MARGTCYGISRVKENALSFEPSDIYDLAGDEFDYVGEENLDDDIRGLMKWLEDKGTDVQLNFEDGEAIFSIKISDDVKRNCFRSQYEEFKKKAAAVTLDDFALRDPYQLRNLVEDVFSDAVYSYEMGFLTLDRWIREAECGKTYYLAKAYLIH